jgi:beta-galactosidase
MKKWTKRVYYGGDYNPDQWDQETILEDMRLFKKAGINMVTLPVFSWAKLEPEEGVYNFGWLDELMTLFAENAIAVCLATPTVAQPAWLSRKYPEVLPVDISGRKRTHGMRVFFCYNSVKYRERAAAIAHAMGKRYGNHPALAIWHVANEYGTYCYCPTCQSKFRIWLKERYSTIENLNNRWHTSFWGRTVYSFEEIMLPTELNDDDRFNPVIQLDYLRFVTDSTVECYLNEALILKSYSPEIPVQTNMSGFIKKLDQFEMSKHMDIVGWDNYPSPHAEPSLVALKHDIMRGLKNGRSFMLSEQSPNQQNWQPYNKLKRPGEVRILSYQAMAHGADTCLFFQMRQSVAGQEKFHGAILSHSGREDTRVFEETAKLGAELAKLGDLFIDGRIDAKVGLIFDWNNWWALENSSGPSKDMNYLETVHRFYKPFYEKNIPVDIISTKSDLSKYEVLVLPMLYMLKDSIEEKIKDFVFNGGTVIGTYLTGVADENDRCIYGAYPGPLKEVFGLWIEESDALSKEETNQIVMVSKGYVKECVYQSRFLCDLLRLDNAESLAVYGKDFYAGKPCITRNTYGKGKAYYVATMPEDSFLNDFFEVIGKEVGIKSIYEAQKGVELTVRHYEDRKVIFVINHNEESSSIDFGEDILLEHLTDRQMSGMCVIAKRDVWILRHIAQVIEDSFTNH